MKRAPLFKKVMKVRSFVCEGLKRKSSPHPRDRDARRTKVREGPTAEPSLKHIPRMSGLPVGLEEWSAKSHRSRQPRGGALGAGLSAP